MSKYIQLVSLKEVSFDSSINPLYLVFSEEERCYREKGRKLVINNILRDFKKVKLYKPNTSTKE